MLSHRGKENRVLKVTKGPKRQGSSTGYRVRLVAADGVERTSVTFSVYPEDARKFALELLQMADECEKS